MMSILLSAVCLLSLLPPPALSAAPPGQAGGAALSPGVPTERELKGGESHVYRVRLEVGQYLRAVVDQKGVDVLVRLFAPGGQKLVEVDSPNGTQGPEQVFVIADEEGEYRLEVRALDAKAPPGRYEARVEEAREATARDRNRIAAERALAEATQLRNQGTMGSLPAAIERYKGALPLLRSADDRRGEAETLTSIGVLYWSLGENQKALDYYGQALPLWRALGDRKEEAVTIHNFGTAHWQAGNSREALEYYRQALSLRREVGDRQGEADTLNAMGLAYGRLGELQVGLGYMERALTLRRAVGDRRGEANTLNNLGTAYEGLGELQNALDYFGRALSLWREVGERRGEATTLSNIGVIELQLGESQRALERHSRALLLQRETGNRPAEASTLYNIGNVYRWLGDSRRALEYFNQALSLTRAIADPHGEAYVLSGIGTVYGSSGEPSKALEALNKALLLRRQVGDRGGEAITLTLIGANYSSLGKPDEALSHLKQALSLSRAIGDRQGEAEALSYMAGAERDLGRFERAREHMEAALDIGERTRSALTGQQHRTSFSASRQKYYEFYIDLLMRMHRAQPSAGHAAAALQAKERARARGLLEMLTESRADIRRGVDATLLDRERSLGRQLSAKAEQLTRLLGGKHTDEEGAAAQKEVDDLLTEYREVEGQIRARSPRYAALMQPRPLSSKEIQQELDQNTLLLEYSLGKERSYLWAVTRSSVESFELPKRSEVEARARRAYDLLTARKRVVQFETAGERRARVARADAEYTRVAAELSRVLLDPVARLIEGNRLLVVGDEVLQYLPFAALPLPKALRRGRSSPDYVPLVARHEVVSLPSASVLAELRKELAGRSPAPGVVAVFADPVFSKDDERVSADDPAAAARRPTPGPSPPAVNSETGSPLTRSVNDLAAEGEETRSTLRRLPFTRQEAEAIVSLVPAGQFKMSVDFAASRESAVDPALGRYRYVHFATHSIINARHPELSGIVLSLFDKEGRARQGFLMAHEVYNLSLPAEMVALSGCRTGLGKEVRGEGLVGLTRGFMYAGAARVLVSLWDVGDESTAELMARLYRGVLKEGLRPAEALRRAQLEMWKEARWRSPYHWAAFSLQGEYR